VSQRQQSQVHQFHNHRIPQDPYPSETSQIKNRPLAVSLYLVLKYWMTYRPGKDITIEFKVRLHFPSSISKEERDWLEANLRNHIADDAQVLFEKILGDR
jgi:hypothetical protein